MSATTLPAPPPRALGARLRRAAMERPWILSAALVLVLCAINLALQPAFLQPRILVSNLTTFLPLIVIAIGQTYVVLGGSIDLSLGAVVSLVNVIVVTMAEGLGGGPGAIAAAMGAGLAAGTLVGLVNGAIISGLRLQPIVTTFASSIVVGGLALMVMPQAGGSLPDSYYGTYGGTLLGVPTPLLILAGLVAAAAYLARTRFYIGLLAVGGQRQAAYQTGLPVAAIRIASHGLGGFLAAIAALCILGVTGAGDPLMGQAFTLGSVSAVVLGGTALSGGWGGVTGAVLGGLALGLVNNVIFFAAIDYAYQSIVQGVIVLCALGAGVFVSRRVR